MYQVFTKALPLVLLVSSAVYSQQKSESDIDANSTQQNLGLKNESLHFIKPGVKFASKIFLRSSGGKLNNIGTAPGSTITYGGGNIGCLFFLSKTVAVGLAYKVESNFTRVPLRGMDIISRYYYLGQGTIVESSDSSGNRFVTHGNFMPYIGAEFSSREFNLEVDPDAADPSDRVLTGGLSAFNAIAGFDYRIGNRWELNLELSQTLLPFGGNDPRVRISWLIVQWGVNHVF